MKAITGVCVGAMAGMAMLLLASCTGGPSDSTSQSPGNGTGAVTQNSGTASTNTGGGTGQANTWSGMAASTPADIFGKSFTGTVTGSMVSQGILKWYFARPKTEGEYPGIVMIHEWWGLNDTVKYMADLLANEGYQVFAIDLYGEVANTQERARDLSNRVRNDQRSATQKLQQAVAYLKGTANAPKVASLGWCFGGGQSLNLSLASKLDGTVIYYGNLVTDSWSLKNISWPVLGVFWDRDTSIPVDTVKAFQKSLNDLGIENQVYVYPWVGHAFANPTGNNFSKPETLDAWNKTTAFLKENLK